MAQNKRPTSFSHCSMAQIRALTALKILINATNGDARIKVQFDGPESLVEPEVRARLKDHGLLRTDGGLTRKGRARLRRAVEIVTA